MPSLQKRLALAGAATLSTIIAGYTLWAIAGSGLSAQVMTPPTASGSTAALSKLEWKNLGTIIPAMGNPDFWESPYDSRSAGLGCFTERVEWTEERRRCAPSQMPFVERLMKTKSGSSATLPVLSTGAILAAIDLKFISEEERKANRLLLQSAAQETFVTLGIWAQQDKISADQQLAIQEPTSALRAVTFSEAPLAMAEVNARLATVQKAIEDILVILAPPPKTGSGAALSGSGSAKP